MLLIEHLIELLSTKKIKKVESTLTILFSAIRLQVKK